MCQMIQNFVVLFHKLFYIHLLSCYSQVLCPKVFVLISHTLYIYIYIYIYICMYVYICVCVCPFVCVVSMRPCPLTAKQFSWHNALQSRFHVSDICLQWQWKLLLVCRVSFILNFCHNQKEETLCCGHMSFWLLLLVCHWAITPTCYNCKNYEKKNNIYISKQFIQKMEKIKNCNSLFMFHYNSHSFSLSFFRWWPLDNNRLLTFHFSSRGQNIKR